MQSVLASKANWTTILPQINKNSESPFGSSLTLSAKMVSTTTFADKQLDTNNALTHQLFHILDVVSEGIITHLTPTRMLQYLITIHMFP